LLRWFGFNPLLCRLWLLHLLFSGLWLGILIHLLSSLQFILWCSGFGLLNLFRFLHRFLSLFRWLHFLLSGFVFHGLGLLHALFHRLGFNLLVSGFGLLLLLFRRWLGKILL